MRTRVCEIVNNNRNKIRIELYSSRWNRNIVQRDRLAVSAARSFIRCDFLTRTTINMEHMALNI